MKSSGTSYLLWLGSLFGVAGLHRFYLGRPVTGALWLVTWGLFGIGSVLDLFLIPGMTRDENHKRIGRARMDLMLAGAAADTQRALPPPERALPPPEKKESPERQILRLAAAHGGTVTAQLVALQTEMSIADARRELRALVAAGDGTVDVREDGAEEYCIMGLGPSRPVLG
jgi:hypothetical protein